MNVVGGPIGAGKSSILHAVEACTQYEHDVHVFLENMEDWQYYLERFYASPKEYVFMFQKEVEMHFFRMTKRLEQLAEESGDRVVTVYVERAPSDVSEVFLALNRDIMEPKQYECLVVAMRAYAARDVWANAFYYNVECPIEVCQQRIAAREREGEQHITHDYLKSIHGLYTVLFKDRGGRSLQNYGLRHSLLQSVRIVTDLIK